MKLLLRPGIFTTVDRTCPAWVRNQKWSLTVKNGRHYAYRSVPGTSGRKHDWLHRVIAGATSGQEVDHINGDSLDNRKQNLRICMRPQNGCNLRKWKSATASQYKGVSSHQCGKWRAYIAPAGRQVHLGFFETERLAAKAYDRAAIKFFGKFARTNL